MLSSPNGGRPIRAINPLQNEQRALTCRIRIKGQWLSVVDVTLAPKAQTDILESERPRVLRVLEGRIRLSRFKGRNPETRDLAAGAVFSIAAGETYAYTNLETAPAALSGTLDASEAEREMKGTMKKASTSLAA
ncbi:hypothetical protein [Oryzifoliimicrobium ureilyticus]|uniref:hypothetical protein n=1 Tax=Oryzifoliimicrobium ureilyticus TaxID=3113724 RepID=UPI0030762757